MPAISKATRQQIKGYLEGFIEGMRQEYRQWQRRACKDKSPPRATNLSTRTNLPTSGTISSRCAF